MVEGVLDKAPTWVFKLMLLAATLFWGFGFVAVKESLDVMPPALLQGIRFSGAALLMLLFFHRTIIKNMNLKMFGLGVFLGLLFFMGYWTQTIGLADTTPSKNAFLTTAYCILTPFVYWFVAKRRPTAANLSLALLCFAGIGLVSLTSEFQIGWGDAMSLVCAAFYAVHISFLGYLARGRDIFTLAFIQFAVCGICGLTIGLVFEPLPSLEFITPDVLGQIAYLTVCSSFAACLFQNLGQSRVPPVQASLIMCLESVFGMLFSVMFYGETLTVRVLLGFALIFIAIVANDIAANKELSWRKKTTSS